jgi:hypothetical protein
MRHLLWISVNEVLFEQCICSGSAPKLLLVQMQTKEILICSGGSLTMWSVRLKTQCHTVNLRCELWSFRSSENLWSNSSWSPVGNSNFWRKGKRSTR